MANVIIPKFLEHLPVYRGLPVPFTVLVKDGVPDFRVIDDDKKKQAVLESRCGICGYRLGRWKWFVGRPRSLEESSLFSDPAMHQVCAEFAIRTCPFLAGRTWDHNPRPLPTLPDGKVMPSPLVASHRSDKIGMRKCREYFAVNVQGYGLIEVRRWGGSPVWLA